MQTTAAYPTEPAQNDLVQVGGGSGIPFNGNQVKKAVALLPREQASALVWLFEHGRDHQFDLDGLAAHLRQARRLVHRDDALRRLSWPPPRQPG